MSLNVREIACILKCGVVPVELPHPEMNRGVTISDGADVALEVTMVCYIEPYLAAQCQTSAKQRKIATHNSHV